MPQNNLKAMTNEQILEIAMTAGKILLCSGAETYRVEDTMLRMCAARGLHTVSAFCTPSVLIVSAEGAEGNTCVYRVINRNTDLSLVSEISDISFKFSHWPYDYKETMAILKSKADKPLRAPYVDVICAGIGAAAFTLMLGGDTSEASAAFVASLLAMWVVKIFSPFKPSAFWSTAIAGAVLCGVTLLFKQMVPGTSMELVIAGAIMPYVPGMPFTNGLRDYMAGDLISGNSRVSEAILLVMALVVGIAAVLGIASKFGLIYH